MTSQICEAYREVNEILTLTRTKTLKVEEIGRMVGANSMNFDKFIVDLNKAIAPLPGSFIDSPLEPILDALKQYGWTVKNGR